MITLYTTSRTVPGYGPRIFIKKEDTLIGPEGFTGRDVYNYLKRASVWEGHDKDTGHAYGFEYTQEKFDLLLLVLIHTLRCTVVEMSEANEREVWA